MEQKEINARIEEVKKRIEDNQEVKRQVHMEFMRAYAPQGYKTYTSYLDADTIHGSRKEKNISQMAEQFRILENLIYIDSLIVENLERQREKIDLMNDLQGLEQQIFYLHDVMGMTLEQTAFALNYSPDHVRRIHAKINKKLSA